MESGRERGTSAIQYAGQPQLRVDEMSLEDLEEAWMVIELEREMMIELGRVSRPVEIAKLRRMRVDQRKITKLMQETKTR